MIVIPHGVEHKPEAKEEVHILLIEPKNVLNTGDAEESELTNLAEKI
jgi:mannose-6-phosphate isomerase-like protein (cupin superfamily)